MNNAEATNMCARMIFHSQGAEKNNHLFIMRKKKC